MNSTKRTCITCTAKGVNKDEVPLWSKHLKVAGRVDCVGHFDGKPAIIDFKTATEILKSGFSTHRFYGY